MTWRRREEIIEVLNIGNEDNSGKGCRREKDRRRRMHFNGPIFFCGAKVFL